MEMYHFSLTALFIFCNAAEILANLPAPAGPRKLYHDAADSFKVFQSFPHAVAIEDTDNNTMFHCWTAERTTIDSDARTATYVGHFPAVGRTRTFRVKAVKDVPRFTFTLDDDLAPKEGAFYYTDYENCVVEGLEYHGHQCVLWVKKELKNSVPQNCLDYYADICGVGFPEYSRELLLHAKLKALYV
uniref:Putative lipocalin-5 1 n=1 Tax=Hyalomma excavatum TaxID=257692 RepID=A0A131XKD0_9ACAR